VLWQCRCNVFRAETACSRQIAVADLTTVVGPLVDALDAFDALRAGDIMKALIAPGS
jgi:hypothetical protein